MRFAIRSNGFDSDQHPVRNYLIRNGGRTSIRASGYPSWPSHINTELNLAKHTINGTGNNDPVASFIDSRDPIHRVKFRGHVSGETLEDFYVDSDSLSGVRAIQNIGGKDGLDVDGTNGVITFTTPDSETLGQFYTMFFVWYPRETNSGWRTFYRGNNDHQPMIRDNTRDLGFYSNRVGNAFYDTGYDIELKWQTLIVVGKGTTALDGNGESLYYVDGQYVGSVPRTKSGSTWSSFGYSGQYPGYFRDMGIFGSQIDSDEVSSLHTLLYESSLKRGQFTSENYTSELLHSADDSDSALSFDSDFTLNFNPILYNTRQRESFRDSVTNRVRIAAGGTIRDQYTPTHVFPIRSNNNNVPYDADAVKNEDNFSRDITVRRQIPTNVSGGGGGGGGGGSSTPDQIWY